MVWNPADVRARHNLNLTADDREKIDRRMHPLQRGHDGLYPADAVFEGGGVLGTAFLGAVRCCADVGIRWNGLAGTSAGSITAALLAADISIDQLEAEIGGLDFAQFLSTKTSWLIQNGDPADDLNHPFRLVANLWAARQAGQYSTQPFRDWLSRLLSTAGRNSFGEIRSRATPPADRLLKVVVSDLTRGLMRVLPDDLDRPTATADTYDPLTPEQDAFEVAEAVRLSMSIPLFFEPGRLGDSTIVDGGILSNFPLWIFDEPVPGKTPAWPTFGFRLLDGREGHRREIDSAPDILAAMFQTMMEASDRHYIARKGFGRVVSIDLAGLPVTATQFGLGDDLKESLYVRGYLATKEFFLNHWSWPVHLTLRGFPTPPADHTVTG